MNYEEAIKILVSWAMCTTVDDKICKCKECYYFEKCKALNDNKVIEAIKTVKEMVGEE